MGACRVRVLTKEEGSFLSPMLHGHFAEHLGRCCVDGLWVGRRSSIPNEAGFHQGVLRALARLGLPVLRWPGGCYADTYHWRDGIGPGERRPRTLGESCGLRVAEENGLGTHEFIDLCRRVGAEPYLAGNVGSGSPQEMADWVHYCNGTLDTDLVRQRAANGSAEPMNVRYWGVGNENWGCGGNYDAADYAKEFRRYATFIKMADPNVELVACGHTDPNWNRAVMEVLRDDLALVDHLSVHRYYAAGRALDFDESEYYASMRAGQLVGLDVAEAYGIVRSFCAGRKQVKIAFDEWGIWHPEATGATQYEAPSTLRDAVAAAGVLDAFHRWAHALSMANLAQVVNVLQCLVQTRDDRFWVTPTYHLFDLYRVHRGAVRLGIEVDCDTVDAPGLADAPAGPLPILSATASTQGGGIAVSVSNRHISRAVEVEFRLDEGRIAWCEAASLAADSPAAVNSAEDPERVAIRRHEVRPADGAVRLELPPCSVHTLVLTCE
ncbi:MAG: alpha-N-arabinofuranosidase [Chthonomonadales bacterium]